MQRYKYRAVNSKGRQVRGVIAAANEIDLHNQLQSSGMELVQCGAISDKKGKLAQLGGAKIKLRDLIQLFTHLLQMQTAGVPLLDSLGDIRDTTEHNGLRDIMSEIYRDVSEGSSLSEAMGKHPKVFTSLFVSLVSSGEETGDLSGVYKQLIKYMKWVDGMQAKVRKATRYPMFVGGFVIITVVVMMAVVVPQIIGFIEGEMKTEIPIYTRALMVTSDFCVNYWYVLILTPIAIVASYKVARSVSDTAAYQLDALWLKAPKFGSLIRKINIARFSQTFGALFASGIPVLQGLEAAQKTITNLAISEALDGVREQVQNGSPLSDAFNSSGEFPSMVVRMLKVGEESGNLKGTLDEVAEFYTQDVDEAVSAMITMIEPMLTLILGGMIMWIAAGVFGPIYESFSNISDLM